MIAADRPVQRPLDARLLVLDARGRITQAPRSRFVEHLRRGDLVIANDAATLPASLRGVHVESGAEIEVRLAGRASLRLDDFPVFTAVAFGAGLQWRSLWTSRISDSRVFTSPRMALKK